MHDRRCSSVNPQNEKLAKTIRARENLDALTFAQAMTGFLPDHPGAAGRAFFGYRAGRYPKLVDLDPAGAGILGRMAELEELGRALDVVLV